MMQQCEIPYLSLDWLVMGFTNGVPEYGIHDKLWPNEIAERFWNFLKGMLDNMIWAEVDYIIEGEAVLPELIVELLEKYPENFIVKPSIAEGIGAEVEKDTITWDYINEFVEDFLIVSEDEIKDTVKWTIKNHKPINIVFNS